jgi:hypothetical protein
LVELKNGYFANAEPGIFIGGNLLTYFVGLFTISFNVNTIRFPFVESK